MRLLLVALVVLAACSTASDAAPPPPDERVVVASFNFDESRLLAAIYAEALHGAGIPARLELDLGPRELVLPALRQGLVDVVPEYLGALLDAAAPGAGVEPSDPALVLRTLAPVLAGWGIDVLDPSDASNQNALVVTRETALERGLTTVSDLGPLAEGLTIGGPPECATRPRCLPGYERVYALQFADFLPYSSARLVQQALDDGIIDVGVLFTTDGYLANPDLVVLTDDRALQPADNVVPVIRHDATDRTAAGEVLDAVSAELSTAELRFMNWRVSVAGNDPSAEARGWLIRHGLLARAG